MHSIITHEIWKGKEMTSIKKQNFLIVTGMVLVFFIAGCASEGRNLAIIVAQAPKGEQVTIEKLIEDFGKYEVYYSGTKPSTAVSVLFCPKDADTMIRPDRWWIKVNDQVALKDIVSWMNSRIYRLSWPHVQYVMGPNNRLFGYMYMDDVSFYPQIKTRVTSERELIVYAPLN